MTQATILFSVAYLAGVFGLVYFDLNVLALGDPKFKGAVDLYFPLWALFYLPAAITAIVFLWRSRQQGPSLVRLAALYLALIFFTLEISFVFNIHWSVLLLEFLMLGMLFRQFMQITKRNGNA